MPDIDYQRLVEGVRSARRVMQADREYRVRAIERYQGKISPVNLTELYVRIVTRSIVAKEPRFHYSTFTEALRPSLHTMQLWYNGQIKRQGLAKSLSRCTYDALLKIGIMKVSLASPADVAMRGYEAEIAQPLASPVDFDDFVYDVRATDLKMASFVGHRFRIPLSVAKNMSMYGKGRHELGASKDGLYNVEGDLRATAIDREPFYQDFEDWTELWEIYLPRYGLIVTLADDQLGGVSLGADNKPLRVQKWLGPPCGPYHYLAYNPIPGQALPNGTMRSLLILDEAINVLYRKLIRQATRQKKNTLVKANADKDNKIFQNANDGDMVPSDDPQGFTEVSRGGPDKVNDAFVQELKQVFSFMGGNLETLGGLVPQAKTAHQEEILNQNSSGGISDMQDGAQLFAASICEAENWYWWYHPTKTMETQYSIPGMPEISLPLTLTPQQRHAYPIEKMQMMIQPYSMASRTPQQMLAALTQAVIQIFVPLQAQMQAAGVQLNLRRFAEMYSELNDMPEFAEILETAAPQPAGTTPDQDGPPQPAKETVRTNASEATGPGQTASIRQALLGQDAGGDGSYGDKEEAA